MNGYFTIQDERCDKIHDFTIPEAWWSRFYEYAWAQKQIIPGEVVVDAGSGPNYPLQYVLAQTCRVYSIDINPDILNSKAHENITHIVAGIEDMPLPDGSVDTVYCISVLEHLKKEDAQKALNEFYRILKPGGRTVLTLDIAPKSGYSCIKKAPDLFEMAAGFTFKDYEPKSPPDAIYDRTCGLLCYHAILHKEAL